MVKGYIGLNDRVKATGFGKRKDTGKVVEVPMSGNKVVVEYDNGDRVSIDVGNVRKTK